MAVSGYPGNLIQEIRDARLSLQEAGGTRAIDGADVVEVVNGHLSDPKFTEVLDRKYRRGESVDAIAKCMMLNVNKVNKLIDNAVLEVAMKFKALFVENPNEVTLDSSIRSIPYCSVKVIRALEKINYMYIRDLMDSNKWMSSSQISKSVRENISQFVRDVSNGSVSFSNDIAIGQYSLFDVPEVQLVGSSEVQETVEESVLREPDSLADILAREEGLPDEVVDLDDGEVEVKEETLEEPPEEQSKVENVSENSQIFVLLKRYAGQVIGMDISKRNDALSRTRTLAESELPGLNAKIIDLSEEVARVLQGNTPLAGMSLFKNSSGILNKLEEVGVQTLEDLTKITKQDFIKASRSGGSLADRLEKELRYRGYTGFMLPVEKKVLSEENGSEESEKGLSVEEMSELPLPLSFRSYFSARGTSGSMSDEEILQLYQEYLDSMEERNHDSYVLMGLRESEESVPVGVIHVIEGLKDRVVFKKENFLDRWFVMLMKLYINEISDDFSDDWKKELYSSVCANCLDKYGSVDLIDVYKFISTVNWNMDSDHLVLIYNRYRSSAEIFVKRPHSKGYESNLSQLVSMYNKSVGIKISPSMFHAIDEACKKLNVSYAYAIAGLKDADSLHEVKLLYSWFNFNYKNMKMFLSMYKDFDKYVEV